MPPNASRPRSILEVLPKEAIRCIIEFVLDVRHSEDINLYLYLCHPESDHYEDIGSYLGKCNFDMSHIPRYYKEHIGQR